MEAGKLHALPRPLQPRRLRPRCQMGTGTSFVRQTLSLRGLGGKCCRIRLPAQLLPGVGAALALGLWGNGLPQDAGLGGERGSALHGQPQAQATCSLLAGGNETGSHTCLMSCWRRSLGSGCDSSRARLEVQVAEGMTDDTLLCTFLGERLGP